MSLLKRKVERMKSLFTLLRSGQAHDEGEESASVERYRRAALTSATLIVARLLNIAIGLASIPITLNYLGDDQFGLWMTLTGFVAFLTFTDFGMGVGVQNALIKCKGEDDTSKPSAIVGAGITGLSLIALLLISFGLFVLPGLPVGELIKFKSPETRDVLLPTAQAMIVGFAVGLPAGLVQRVCDAYQRGYWGYGFLILGRIAAFVGVVAAAFFEWTLPILAAIFITAPFVSMGVGFVFVVRRMPWVMPRFSSGVFKEMRGLLQTGVLVLFCHLGYAILNSSPALIIANQTNAASVAPFSIAQKMLGAITVFISPVLQSFWGAVGEASVRGDSVWIRKTARMLLSILVLVAVPISIFTMIFGQDIISWWTGNEQVVPSRELLCLCLIWVLIQVFDQKFSMILNAMNLFGARAAVMVFFSIFAFAIIASQDGAVSVEKVVFVFVFCAALPVLTVNAIYGTIKMKGIGKA